MTFAGKYRSKTFRPKDVPWTPVVSEPRLRDTGARPESRHPADRGTGAKIPSPQYSGTEVLGIAVMHKSCLQPVFSAQEAEDSAHMRR